MIKTIQISKIENILVACKVSRGLEERRFQDTNLMIFGPKEVRSFSKILSLQEINAIMQPLDNIE